MSSRKISTYSERQQRRIARKNSSSDDDGVHQSKIRRIEPVLQDFSDAESSEKNSKDSESEYESENLMHAEFQNIYEPMEDDLAPPSSEQQPQQINNERDDFNDDLLDFSDDSDEFTESPELEFRQELRQFCLKHLNDTGMKDLLKLLKNSNKFRDLPSTIDELLDSPTGIMPNPVKIENGEYLHLGIRQNLLLLQNIQVPNPLVADFSWDGVRIFKASNKQMWPLVMSLEGLHEIFLIGVFIGTKKPKHNTQYFYCLRQELDQIAQNNDIVEVGATRAKFKFDTSKYLADTPARLWAQGTLSHAGFCSCPLCKQKGRRFKGRTVFQKSLGEPRTHEEATTRNDKEHYVSDTPFRNCRFVKDLVFSFVTDLMHLLDTGVTGKYIRLLIEQKKINIDLANLLIDALTKYIPTDFPRKIRRLDNFEHFKAAELRFFAIYCGIVIIKQCCSKEIFINFLDFFVAYRLLLGKNGKVEQNHIIFAQTLINRFVTKFASIFGEEHVSWNIHGLLHVPELVKMYGPIDKLTCYRFENYYMLMRKWIRKPSAIFQQIYSRWKQTRGVATNKTGKNKFNFFNLTHRQRDNCILLKDKRVFLLTKFKVTVSGPQIKGNSFLEYRHFFTQPIVSTDIDIFEVSGLNSVEEIINPDEIDVKMTIIPFNNNFVVIPINHYQM